MKEKNPPPDKSPSPAEPDERTDIRELTHRAVGSRQSSKPVERSRQPRQPKTGGSGGHGKKRAE